ncbi:MAG: hypothetical protein Q4G58_13470 [bacterium]|nr:hypothetical protein [bacterium]
MGNRDFEIEQLKIQDTKYRRIQIDQGENQDITVPLEEAIVINDEEVRRKLMLDILHKKPEDYINLLQRTRLSDDVELTHYATTSMMEIQSNYELNIQKLSQACRKNPDCLESLEKYRQELKSYIASGLISGTVLTIYRSQLHEVLIKLVTIDPEQKEYFRDLIENQVEMKQYSGIMEMLTLIKEKWKEEEIVYQLFVKYYFSIGRGDLIANVLEEVRENKVYLTNEGRNWFQFWSQEEA